MQRKPFTRRRFMATSAAVSASMIAAPFVRSARAAGSLTIGMWDHWVPGANDMQSAIIKEWADAE
jgi:ABC-type glycerol-3-phosphate transport system substrate-binding protein